MSYSPNMSMDRPMFDKVFVNPEAHKAFLQTGTLSAAYLKEEAGK
jgi:hypothetical protein